MKVVKLLQGIACLAAPPSPPARFSGLRLLKPRGLPLGHTSPEIGRDAEELVVLLRRRDKTVEARLATGVDPVRRGAGPCRLPAMGANEPLDGVANTVVPLWRALLLHV